MWEELFVMGSCWLFHTRACARVLIRVASPSISKRWVWHPHLVTLYYTLSYRITLYHDLVFHYILHFTMLSSMRVEVAILLWYPILHNTLLLYAIRYYAMLQYLYSLLRRWRWHPHLHKKNRWRWHPFLYYTMSYNITLYYNIFACVCATLYYAFCYEGGGGIHISLTRESVASPSHYTILYNVIQYYSML